MAVLALSSVRNTGEMLSVTTEHSSLCRMYFSGDFTLFTMQPNK